MAPQGHSVAQIRSPCSSRSRWRSPPAVVQLEHGVVGADAVAVVAAEAVAAGQAPAGLEERGRSRRARRRPRSNVERLRPSPAVAALRAARRCSTRCSGASKPAIAGSARGPERTVPRSHASMWPCAFFPWPIADGHRPCSPGRCRRRRTLPDARSSGRRRPATTPSSKVRLRVLRPGGVRDRLPGRGPARLRLPATSRTRRSVGADRLVEPHLLQRDPILVDSRRSWRSHFS